jgi:hypothetical protein
MSINGVSASALNGARAASSDGVDDFGVAGSATNGPHRLPNEATHGFAFTFLRTSTAAKDLFGSSGRDSIFLVRDRDGNGQIQVSYRDSGGGNFKAVDAKTTKSFSDGQLHLCCINKQSENDANDIFIYIDDMQTPKQTTTVFNKNFQTSDYISDEPLAFFAFTDEGNLNDFHNFSSTFFEFNEQPYSQQDRLELKQRAPGL